MQPFQRSVALTLTGLFAIAFTAASPLPTPPGPRAQVVAGPDLEDGPKDNRRSIVIDDGWADHEVAPNRALIRFRSDLAPQGREDLLAEMKATVAHSFERLVPGLRCLEIEESIAEFLERYRFRGDVLEFIEPDYVVSTASAPAGASSNSAPYLWPLQRIDVQAAYDLWPNYLAQDAPWHEYPLVAIIDTGIYLEHEYFLARIWRNQGEIPGNGVDDDGNGYIDDVHGYNWSGDGDDDDVNDWYGHGTHVAGTVGAQHLGGVGAMAGVCRASQLMALKALGDDGYGFQSWTSAAVEYAALNGAKVANMSLGGTYQSMSEYLAIEAAGRDHGVIVVAAAGNESSSIPSYPAGYDLNNIISVAAINSAGTLAGFSNYGPEWVDLCAPGVDILSTKRGGGFEYKNGTSMAAPHVAGVVAMLYDLRSQSGGGGGMSQVINAVLDAARDHPQEWGGITATDGELNAGTAMAKFLSGWEPFECSVYFNQGSSPDTGRFCQLYTDFRPEMLPLGPDGWHGFLPNCQKTYQISGCGPSDPAVTVHAPYIFEIGGIFWEPGIIYTISVCHPDGLDLVSSLSTWCDDACAGPAPDGCDSGFSYKMNGCSDYETDNPYRYNWLIVGSPSAPDPDLVRELRVTVEASYPGDLNDDDHTDGADLALLLADWGACDGCLTDFDRDGVVGGSDLAVILGYWGEAASPQTCESATPIGLNTPTAFEFGPLDEDLAVGGCLGIDDGLRSVNWYSFIATSSGAVKIGYQHDGPAEGLEMGFVVMESCDVGSRLTCSKGEQYAPNGSCFHFWADFGKTYKIAAGTSAYQTRSHEAPTSGSGVITLFSPQEECDGVDNDADGYIDEIFDDTDGDGTADCVDNCPDDPNKTEPGECGCGFADTDTDQDGTLDCNDPCPYWPYDCSEDGNTITVAVGQSIPLAVDAVPTGGTVEIAAGTFPLTTTIDPAGKAVTIRGATDESNAAISFIDGGMSIGVLHCVSGEGPDTVFENLVIQNGYAHRGGGMFNWQCSPTLHNCTFTINSADEAGGGMWNENSNPTLNSCTFTDNSAVYGGGMFNYSSSPTLTACTFTNNSSSQGGAMMNQLESNPTLNGCTFTNNPSTYGGGMFNYDGCNPALDSCTFTDNPAEYGGGMYNSTNSSPTINSCTFTNNTSIEGGGMVNWSNSSPTLNSCTFTDNSATSGGGGMRNVGSNPNLTDCIVCSNSPDQILGEYTDGGGNSITEVCDTDGD